PRMAPLATIPQAETAPLRTWSRCSPSRGRAAPPCGLRRCSQALQGGEAEDPIWQILLLGEPRQLNAPRLLEDDYAGRGDVPSCLEFPHGPPVTSIDG